MGKLSALWDIAAKPVAGAAAIGASVAPEDAEAGVITKGGKRLIEAWHGSPHSFDKFDISKIGTGEGAQAYGHGLYFADAPEVAREYKNKLRFPQIDSPADLVDQVADDLNYHGGNEDSLRSIYTRMVEQGDDRVKRIGAEKLAAIDLAKERYSGSLYRTHIDVDPDTLLDYDKPLSEQPEVARSALLDMRNKAMKSFQQIDPEGNPTAGQVMHLYSQHRGNNPAEVSSELRNAGIPGIRYRDQMSRNAAPSLPDYDTWRGYNRGGAPDSPELRAEYSAEQQKAADFENNATYNYVMFDDKPISIVDRGFADPALLGAIGVGAATTTALAPEMYRQMEETRRVVSDFATRRAPKASFWQQKRQELADLMGAGVAAATETYGTLQDKGFIPQGTPFADFFSQRSADSQEPVRAASALAALVATQDPQKAAGVYRMPQEAIADEAGGLVTDYLSQAGYPRAGALAGTAANVGINMAGF